jgi:hypothetical protein
MIFHPQTPMGLSFCVYPWLDFLTLGWRVAQGKGGDGDKDDDDDGWSYWWGKTGYSYGYSYANNNSKDEKKEKKKPPTPEELVRRNRNIISVNTSPNQHIHHN